MSGVGIIMDVILMGLLIAALWFGLRLDKRLKSLRSAHDSFARAVADLDQAAMKAHVSLKGLREGADETQELLHGRILVARDLLQKLEHQIARAEKAQKEIDGHLEASRQMIGQMEAAPERVSPEPRRPEIHPSETPPQTRAQPEAQKPEIRTHSLRAARPSPFTRRTLEAPDPEVPRPEPQPEHPVRPAPAEPDLPHISEAVVASLNDMLRSFAVPKPKSIEDDLFGAPGDDTEPSAPVSQGPRRSRTLK